MKKIIILLFILLFAQSAHAQTIKVSAVDSFSSEHPASVFSIKTLEDNRIQGMFFKSDTIISGIVLRVHDPSRGKRDGYFEFIPTSITYQGKSVKINMPKTSAEVMYYKPVDPPKEALDVTLKVANFFLRGLITVAEFAHGAIEAPNGQRIKSGATEAYKDSFLSYVEVGQKLNIRPGDILILKLKHFH